MSRPEPDNESYDCSFGSFWKTLRGSFWRLVVESTRGKVAESRFLVLLLAVAQNVKFLTEVSDLRALSGVPLVLTLNIGPPQRVEPDLARGVMRRQRPCFYERNGSGEGCREQVRPG